ncbi:MAG: hypothetical protein AMXMBFR51_21040 [Ignavibacteriota bacterium]
MRIDQASYLTGRSAGVLSRILEVCPLFQYADFRRDPSEYGNIPDKSTFTGSSARAEGASAQKDAQIPSPAYKKLAIYEREITIDNLRKLDTRITGSPNGLKLFGDRQLNALAVKLGQEVQIDMFQGTDSSNRMLGISNFVKDAAAGGQTAALGFTTTEQAAMNYQVSLQLNTTANQDAFVEILFKQLLNVPGANAIICNANLGARLTTIAKRIGAAGETLNSFGIPVNTFNNVPIVVVDTNTITQTESDGTNTDCTSLYIVRFGEELGVTFVTNSGFYFEDFPEDVQNPDMKARLGFYLNLAVERVDALRRLSRIRL